MYFYGVYTRNKAMFNAKLIAFVFLALKGVVQGVNITWHDSNITVTRTSKSPDYFDLWSSKGDDICPYRITDNVCQGYGAIQAQKNCKKACCKRCICERHKPTFIVSKLQCVEDANVTNLSGPHNNRFLFVTSPNTSCSKTDNSIPILDLESPGKSKFLVCSNGAKITFKVKSCSFDPGKHHMTEPWNSIVDVPSHVKKTMQVNNKLLLNWTGTRMTSLMGSVVFIPATCNFSMFSLHGGERTEMVKSYFFLKIAGSRTSQGPKIFYTMSKVPSTQVPAVPSTSTTPSTTMVTEYRPQVNIVNVSGEFDFLLVIVAAVLGALLLLVIAVAIAIIVVFKRRQKLTITGGKHTSNPTYERGPDQTLLQNGQQSTSLKSHFYQPLVENTRDSERKGEPVYESLDDHLRTSQVSLENPHRCSLAYCDVTSDGYLIPTDGPAPVPCPTIKDTETIPSNLKRPRLSSHGYDVPEVVLKDRNPKLTVDLSGTEKRKPYYHELEEENQGKLDVPGNEIAGENCKSPTENTYLELIGEAKTPLESEML